MATRTKKQTAYKYKPEGEITIYNAAAMKQKLVQVLQDHKEVEIDLSKISEVDSAGMQLLILAKRIANNSGKSLRLLRHSEAVLEIFNLYNVAEYFGDPIVLRRDAKQA